MAFKPQGLYPSLNSFISPDIPNSMKLSWSYIRMNVSDKQKAATVKVYKYGSSTAILTQTIKTASSISLLDTNLLEDGGAYEWEVTVTANLDNTTAVSGRQSFIYRTDIYNQDLLWPEGPESYEEYGTRTYFEKIKENAITVLADYVEDSLAETKMFDSLELLFTGDIVPLKDDFEILESALHFIATKEFTYKDEITNLLEDGLGAEDIHKIYLFLERLTQIAPPAPTVRVGMTTPEAMKITSGTAKNNSKTDVTIDLGWTPSSLTKGKFTVTANSDPSEDTLFYVLDLAIGFADYAVSQVLYYRAEDLNDARTLTSFTMNHVEFHHLSKNKQTKYTVKASVGDRRGSTSGSNTVTATSKTLPLGIASYQLSTQRMDANDKKVSKAWYEIYKGGKKAYVHTTKNKSGNYYRYRVRLLDSNGIYSAWYDGFPHILVDPLKPPAAPKPKVKSVTTTTVTFEWKDVPNATTYTIDPPSGGNVTTDDNTYKVTGGKENTTYTIKVRANNRAGSSKWVSVSGKTKKIPVVESIEKKPNTRTWRSSYMIKYQSGRISYPSAEYRTDMNNKEVIHGQWVELRDKKESGLYVKKGTRWGDHRSLFFLDHDDWKKKLKGKTIISVQLYIERLGTSHGYPNDGRFLNVYTHNYAETKDLPKSSTGPSLANHYEIKNLDWNRGQGNWITLPKSYGEKLRDGKIKGIAFHHPKSSSGPYSYMRFEADSMQLKIKYK